MGTFASITLHIFSKGGIYASSVAEILHLINILEEIHTEVQGIITSPHLATTLIFDVSRQWSLYLSRCVVVSLLGYLGAPGAIVPFTLDIILLYMEGGVISGTDLSDSVVKASHQAVDNPAAPRRRQWIRKCRRQWSQKSKGK